MSESPAPWGAWDIATQADPYPLFAEMRSTCPVHQVQLHGGHEAWLVIGHDAARQALRDTRFSKDFLAALDDDPEVVDEGLPGAAFARHMLAVDGEDHRRMRELVARAFAPSRITALEPAIVSIVDGLLDELAAAGPGTVVDLVERFAHPLPFRVIGELFGIPIADQETLYQWFRTLFQPWSGSPPASAVAASDSIVAYLHHLVAMHRAVPHDDLVGVLVAAVADARLTEQELLSSLFQLIVAGTDTTTSLIGNGVVALLDHPDQLHLLTRQPERMAAAVEEIMRYSAPVPHATFRVSTEPVDLAGVVVPAGKQVLVCLGGANHDPDLHEHPDVLDISRAPNGHLGFGHGPHFCLGAPLARLEARIAFTALLGRFPELRLAVPRDDLRWSHGDGLVLRGLAELPIDLHPRPHDNTEGSNR